MMKNPMPELTPLLSKLKLSGISESLARRNKEAIDNKLSYLEFFGLLLQDEILRRENKQFAKRIKQSGFRGDKTIENFDVTIQQNKFRFYLTGFWGKFLKNTVCTIY